MRYLICFAILAGCATESVTSKPANLDHAVGISDIRATLKDPYSAQFSSARAFTLSNGQAVYCGNVNAKNSYGAYTGTEAYYVRKSGGAVEALFLGEWAQEGCKRAASGELPLRG